MAQFSFEEVEARSDGGSRYRSNVGYFNSLKNDGDETLVRFAYNTPAEFDIVTAHRVLVDGRWRSVSCINDPKSHKGECPLCANGDSMTFKFYVKLIEYTTDENGNIVATPKVWERNLKFARRLKALYDEYCLSSKVPFSEYVFKIKRFGEKGSMQTTYEPMWMNPMVYTKDKYVPDFKDFEDFDLAHHSYMLKTKEELEEFVKTGAFPKYKPNESKEDEADAVDTIDMGTNPYPYTSNTSNERHSVQQNTFTRQPSKSSEASDTKPVRRYSF